MKCKICGRKDKKYIKVKGGTICPDCYESLPRIIRDNVADITAKQIINACRILKRADSLAGYWGCIGEWRDEDSIIVGNKSMIINETEIKYSDIYKIYLDFHPTKKYLDDQVIGYATLVVETDKPRLKLEYRLHPDMEDGSPRTGTIRYNIHGNEISYYYDSIDLLLVSGIMDVVTGRKIGLDCIRNTYVRYTEEKRDPRRYVYITEEEKIRRQNREEEMKKESKFRKDRRERQEENARREEEYKRRTWEREKRRQENYKRQQEYKTRENQGQPKTEFDIAKELFDLEIPYTEKELKEKRNLLIKKIHPDAGGSDEDAALINGYYELLKKFAV